MVSCRREWWRKLDVQRGSGCLDASLDVSRVVCRATGGQGVSYKGGMMPPAGMDVEPWQQHKGQENAEVGGHDSCSVSKSGLRGIQRG
jgi:hypothetical protein